jgi:hypothetical protein
VNTHRIVKQLLTVAVASSSLMAAADATASPLPCVQRAIDWNNANSRNRVSVTLVALHEQGIAAYATSTQQSTLQNSGCSLAPMTVTGCLAGAGPMDALLSNRTYIAPSDPDGGFNTNPAQPFAIDQPLSLTVESLRANNAFVTRFRAGSATYDFLPQCVGNLVTGNDQWGNHWTVSFQLYNEPVLH